MTLQKELGGYWQISSWESITEMNPVIRLDITKGYSH
jgi:hypothetical protein